MQPRNILIFSLLIEVIFAGNSNIYSHITDSPKVYIGNSPEKNSQKNHFYNLQKCTTQSRRSPLNDFIAQIYKLQVPKKHLFERQDSIFKISYLSHLETSESPPPKHLYNESPTITSLAQDLPAQLTKPEAIKAEIQKGLSPPTTQKGLLPLLTQRSSLPLLAQKSLQAQLNQLGLSPSSIQKSLPLPPAQPSSPPSFIQKSLQTPPPTQLGSCSSPLVQLKHNPSHNHDLPEFREISPQECDSDDDYYDYDYDCARDRYFFSLQRNQGKTAGNNSSYTTLKTLIFPYYCRDFVPFIDLRGHVFDRCSRFGANLGIGCRFVPQCSDICFGLLSGQIFGINAYYDYRDHRHAHFNQVGLGFEILGNCLNFRLNGYFPVGKREILNSTCVFDDYIGDYFMIQKNFADILTGANFEIESLVARVCSLDVYAAIGSYFYKGNSCRHNIYGNEYRLTARFCDNYLFSICATNDRRYRTRVMAEFNITFPCYDCDWRWYQPVRRREAIAIDSHNLFFSNF